MSPIGAQEQRVLKKGDVMSQADGIAGGSGVFEVLVVDGDDVAREGLISAASGEKDLDVCGSVRDGVEARGFLAHREVDAAVVEMSIDGGHGLEFVEKLRETRPGIKVVVVSACEDLGYVRRAFRVGASGYVSSRGGAVNVIRGIRAVVSGKAHVSDEIVERIIEAKTS
jgi:DNA-binding NarL/FixJ family response regulator